jgi:hypothetical protein
LTKTRARYDAAASAGGRSKHTPLSWITRFDPTRTQLVGHTVKVKGSMTASTDADGLLHVVADYRFVYAVALVGSSDGNAERAMAHRMIEIIAYPDSYRTTPGTYWLYDATAQTLNDLCSIDNGFFNPAFGTPEPKLSGTPVNPYSGTLAPHPDTTPTASPSPASTSGDGCHPTGHI